MKKKGEQKGTIIMGYSVRDEYTSFTAGSITLTPVEIKSVINSIVTELNIKANNDGAHRDNAYGVEIYHMDYSGHIPFDKMTDFIKAARAAGFRVKE